MFSFPIYQHNACIPHHVLQSSHNEGLSSFFTYPSTVRMKRWMAGRMGELVCQVSAFIRLSCHYSTHLSVCILWLYISGSFKSESVTMSVCRIMLRSMNHPLSHSLLMPTNDEYTFCVIQWIYMQN